jgi:hypothetical protein
VLASCYSQNGEGDRVEFIVVHVDRVTSPDMVTLTFRSESEIIHLNAPIDSPILINAKTGDVCKFKLPE